MNRPTKRTLSLFVLVALLLALAACTSAGSGESTGSIPFIGLTPSAGDQAETVAATAAPATSVAPTPPSETDANGLPVGFTAGGQPYRGRLDAPVKMEAFSDFQCPYCGMFSEETLPSLLANQVAAGDAVFIFYDFPLSSIHPYAQPAANAARCAGEAGAAAYWGMHDRLFADIDAWANEGAADVFRAYAAELGLDAADFGACLDEDRYAEAIAADQELGLNRGVNSTPSFFLNEQLIAGAYPLETFNGAITALLNGETIDAAPAGDTAAAAATPSGPAMAPTPATIFMDNIAAARGEDTAGVTIVEYTDYQCPYCQRHAAETLPRMITEMIDTGRVRYVIKDFPLDSIHPQARAGAVAARCAGEQDAYWEMHDSLFTRQADWSGQTTGLNDIFTGLATDLGLDGDAFAACLTSGRFDDLIQANQDEGFALGVNGTPAFFINGFPISGAQQFDLFAYAVGLAEEGTLADAYVQQEQPTPTPSGPVDVDTSGAISIGAADAPVVLVEFTDFQCPYCSRHFAETYPQIVANYVDAGLVRYVFMDFPLTSIHPQAQLAAEAARCANDQDAYIEMHDILFSRQDSWSGRGDAADIFTEFAGELGLDEAIFSDCLLSGRHTEVVQADVTQGESLGVNGTPAFFLNGHFISGAQPYSVFQGAIDSLLAEQG
ncbi:MAG: DsbA family protein [Candidatus Promineofilum sp.]|nr:DsbA family protein [Promineifilum sp.]